MDSVKSGKVDGLERPDFRNKTRKSVVIVPICLLLLAALVVGIVVGTLPYNRKTKSGDPPANQNSAVIRSVCSVTPYPNTCIATLGSSGSSNPEEIFRLSLTAALNSLQRISTFPGEYANRTADPRLKEALAVCSEVLNDAVESLNDTVSAAEDPKSSLLSRVEDLRTWLSAVLTDQETCSDALAEAAADFSDEIALLMKNSTELTSNSLAIISRVIGKIRGFKVPIHRRLLGGDFPAWVQFIHPATGRIFLRRFSSVWSDFHPPISPPTFIAWLNIRIWAIKSRVNSIITQKKFDS